MSIITGIFVRSRNESLPVDLSQSLIRLLAARSEDTVYISERPLCVFAKVDYEIFDSPAMLVQGSSSSMLAGEPRLVRQPSSSVGKQSRFQDLCSLTNGLPKDLSALQAAQGVFCAAYYNTDSHELHLIADKLGVRPLYYWVSEKYVIFSSVLWVLERLPVVPKQLDIRAIAELSVLGCSFGQRTPYRDIQCLRSAEMITFSSRSVQAARYWRWDQIPVSTSSEPELLDAAHAAFGAATGSLAKQDKTVFSFLTGGMDSRCVVASLRERGITVQTFAFGSARSQEKTFAAEYARQAGTIHHEGSYDRRSGEPLPSMLARYLENARLAEPLAERPRLIWSGNGGSVGLGSVYITSAVVDRLRARD